MAFGEQFAAQPPVAFMIYVRPTRELRESSWGWPECWHLAYLKIAGMLGVTVAGRLLRGRSVTQKESTIPIANYCVTFTIVRAGTSITVTISDFQGPEAPGPNDGLGAQPTAIDGLVLGLRGSGRHFSLVRFYGVMLPISPCNILPCNRRNNHSYPELSNDAFCVWDFAWSVRICDVAEKDSSISQREWDETASFLHEWANDTIHDRETTFCKWPMPTCVDIRMKESFGICESDAKQYGLFDRALEADRWNYDSAVPPRDLYRMQQLRLLHVDKHALH